MRIFELLNAGAPTPQDTNGGMIQPSAVQPPPTTPQPPAQQQAGFWGNVGSGIANFMSTPQPIGGSAPKPPPTSAPGTNPAGQPPAQSSGIINRPFGNSAIGQNLDAINKGLQPAGAAPAGPKPPGQP